MTTANIVKEFKGGSMARTFLIKKHNQYFVRKIAENKSLGVDKLKKQWDWLIEVRKSAPAILPKVSFFVYGKDYGYYDMEYINFPTLRDLLLQNTDEDNYKQNIEIVDDYVYYGSVITGLPQDCDKYEGDSYIINNHLTKMVERCKDISKYPLFKNEQLYINGKHYLNLLPLLEIIYEDKEFLELLRPKKWFRSHGDYTFQNVLTDYKSIFIIDPRGESPEPIYYDLAKMYQSCHGKYDLLYEGNYKITESNKDFTEFKYEIYEGVEDFDKYFEYIKEVIPKYNEHKLDEHWDLITRFYEASHFISMTPFRLKENIYITVICYAIGIQILNEVLNEWRKIKNADRLQ